MFDISTIRPTAIKPCKVLLLNVLTWQIPWPGDLDLYFGCSDFDIIYVNIPDLLKCKTSSHQTLHSASPRCTDSAGILTRWPWPIFCAPVPFTRFTSTFNISSTIRPTTIKPCIVLLLNVRTLQVPWLGDLTFISRSIDSYTYYVTLPYVLNCKAFNHQILYSTSSRCTDSAGTLTWWPWPILCTPVTLTHFMLMFGISSNIRPTTTKPCIVLHLIPLAWQVPWTSEDIAIRGNGTGLQYMCPTRHFVYIFFNPVFQVSTAKNEINLFNNHILIVAPVTFAPAGAMTSSAQFLLTV